MNVVPWDELGESTGDQSPSRIPWEMEHCEEILAIRDFDASYVFTLSHR